VMVITELIYYQSSYQRAETIKSHKYCTHQSIGSTRMKFFITLALAFTILTGTIKSSQAAKVSPLHSTHAKSLCFSKSIYVVTTTCSFYFLLQKIPATCYCSSIYFLNADRECECRSNILCSSGKVWSPEKCECLCPPLACLSGQRWDFDLCACVLCHPDICLPGEVWDSSICRCRRGLCDPGGIC
jgi:hypothetical protein